MASNLDKIIVIGLIITEVVITLWSILTPNHLFVG